MIFAPIPIAIGKPEGDFKKFKLPLWGLGGKNKKEAERSFSLFKL